MGFPVTHLEVQVLRDVKVGQGLKSARFSTPLGRECNEPVNPKEKVEILEDFHLERGVGVVWGSALDSGRKGLLVIEPAADRILLHP